VAIAGATDVVQVEDICRADWRSILSGHDFVIHLAALAHGVGDRGEISEAAFFETNAEGTRALCEATAQTASLKRLVFISSIGAVTLASEETIDEKTPCHPRTPYGKSKLSAESFVADTLRESSVDWCILRPPLVFGKGNPGNMERLLKLIKTGVPLPFGGIKAIRSFIYVENLVEALVCVLQDAKPVRDTFCIADEEVLELPKLCRLIAENQNIPSRQWSAPFWMLNLAGFLGDLFGVLRGRSWGYGRGSIERLISSLVIDSKKFRDRFDWRQPVGVDDALRTTFGKGH
jgi:nucleoside-diphosphate-sugar epimerase